MYTFFNPLITTPGFTISITFTVLVTGVAELSAGSFTLYVNVYVPNTSESTDPVTTIDDVKSPYKTDVAVAPGSTYGSGDLHSCDTGVVPFNCITGGVITIFTTLVTCAA